MHNMVWPINKLYSHACRWPLPTAELQEAWNLPAGGRVQCRLRVEEGAPQESVSGMGWDGVDPMSQLNCEVRAEGHLNLNPCQTIAHSSDEIITKAKYLEEEAKRRVNQQDNQDSQDAEDINNDDEDNSSDGGSSNSSPTGTNNAQASVQGNEETDDEDKSLSLGDDDESKEDDVFYENSIAAGDKQQQQQQLSQPAPGPSVIQQDDDEELEWVHLEKLL